MKDELFAFPHQFENVSGANNWLQSQGMSLRDYFAAKAMQASLSDIDRVRLNKIHCENNNTNFSDEVAIQAYDIADAMLRNR